MGIVLNFMRVSEEELDSFLTDSSILDEKIETAFRYEDPDYIDYVDKAWDGICFLLTGKDVREGNNHPLAKIFSSGQEIDIIDGPAEYLTPIQVKELNFELSMVTTEELVQRYNPELMEQLDIYPKHRWGEKSINFLLLYFERLKSFYIVAANNNQAVISYKS